MISANLTGRPIAKKAFALFVVVAMLNLGAWGLAFGHFQHDATLMGLAVVTYGLGLRHAIDADHIAAIDNVTRKLMQEGGRPVTVGFWFAMGHSTIILIGVIMIACATSVLTSMQGFREVGSAVGTGVSVVFLLSIAITNIVIFLSIFKCYRRVRAGGSVGSEDLDLLLSGCGPVSRLLRPLFRLISRSWHMFPLGFLFGLGFDTATEVAMFGVSAGQASQGQSSGAILILPVLFAAAMSLIDTIDGVMMLGAYQWAFVRPTRRLFYNMTITLMSAIVALIIGGIEAVGFICSKMGLTGRLWDTIRELNANSSRVGLVVITALVIGWTVSFLIYRAKEPRNTSLGMTLE